MTHAVGEELGDWQMGFSQDRPPIPDISPQGGGEPTRLEPVRSETDPDRAGTELAKATISVVLPRALLALFPDAPRELQVEARTVAEMVTALDAQWPGMRDRLCDSTPAVRRHINVFVDGRRAKLATPLKDGHKVYVLTAISGG